MYLNFDRINSTCPGQWLYLLGDEGVIYSEIQNRFAGLDAAGVAAYRAFDAGADFQDLRACGDGNSASEDSLKIIHALSRGIFPVDDTLQDWPALGHPETANINIHGIPVFLEYPDGPLENLCRDYFRNCPAIAEPARCHLHAQQEEDGWTIRVNGRALLSQLRNEQIGLGRVI